MKISIPVCVLAVLAAVLAGCSTAMPAGPKLSDLGTIEVSTGQPGHYTLVGGQTCTITPTVLSGDDIHLVTEWVDANAARIKATHTLIMDISRATAEAGFIYSLDKVTLVKLRLHIKNG